MAHRHPARNEGAVRPCCTRRVRNTIRIDLRTRGPGERTTTPGGSHGDAEKRDHRGDDQDHRGDDNAAAIPLAAGVLAWAGFVLPMSVGAALMSLSTIIVAVNAQLLRRVELRPQPP